nr:MAG TPA: hypothetical protein [Caudoviricetes sp.]
MGYCPLIELRLYPYHKDLKREKLRYVLLRLFVKTPKVVSYPSTRRSNPYIKLLYIQ